MPAEPACNFWLAGEEERPARPALAGTREADVTIIGAGFTGLWTAYYLKSLAPALEVAVVEADRVGHGASGRNGGWVIGGIAGLTRHIGHLARERRRACCDLLAANVDVIGAVLTAEGIDADFHKGGSISAAARYPDQVALQKRRLADLHAIGHSQDSCYWLDADALAEHAHFNNGFGGIFHRDYATVHPGKLVTGLAAAVEKRGVVIYEHSRAAAIQSHTVRTAHGRIDAAMVIAATEGYSDGLPELKRHIMPVQSLVIATPPLPPTLWADVGLAGRPSFADASRLINYGHRSADDRMIFGARGDYRWGGRPKHDRAISTEDIRMRQRLLADLFPPLAGGTVDYGWGGSVGLSRSFRPHAIVDRARGIATAGGYAGEGVAASHLFARTLAELILGVESERTTMPWAHHNTPIGQIISRWEPEPIRWLTAAAMRYCYDREETLMRRPGRVSLTKPLLVRINDRLASIVE